MKFKDRLTKAVVNRMQLEVTCAFNGTVFYTKTVPAAEGIDPVAMLGSFLLAATAYGLRINGEGKTSVTKGKLRTVRYPVVRGSVEGELVITVLKRARLL